jgi:hypothetical protein
MKKYLLWLLMFLVCAATAFGQLPVGTILGTVKDSSGAFVAGAQLTIRNQDTGLTRTTVSGADGSYRFDALPVGSYEIRTEQAGFRTEVRSGITLFVAQQATVDIALEVGTISQQVQVTSAAQAVDTTTSSLTSTVNEQQMSNLPLNGRNYIQLALLQPGAAEFKNHATGSNANLGTTGTFLSINGAPPRANAYLLDGTSLTVYGGATGASISGSTLGLDGIKEFSIVTNNFSAEYGMVMGSQMLMVSKGGTNTFHGDAFDYLRNSSLDARNFFDTPQNSGTSASGAPRRLPEYRRNNFGGSVGGPIQKDKTFFFTVYEGLREYLGETNLSFTIPTGCEGPAGATITVAACPALGSTPSVVVSPVSAPWFALFPKPNVGTTETSWGFTQPTVEDYGQVRVDHVVSNVDNFFGRYTIDNTTQSLASTQPGYPSAAISRGQFLTLSENHIFNPALLNTARFSYSRSNLLIGVNQYATGPDFSFIAGLPMGQLDVGGVSTLSAGGLWTSQGLQDVFSYSDDLFDNIRNHSLKFGFLINHFQVHGLNGTDSWGTVEYANVATLLAGNPSTWTAIAPPDLEYKTVHYNTLGFYAEDNFRLRPRLTVNYGLRYEFNTNINEIHGMQSAIRNLVTDAEPTVGLMMTDPSYLNFSPRLGVAWDVRGDGKTAVRAGFAEVYNIAGWVGILHQAARIPPYVNQISVDNPVGFSIPIAFPSSTALTARSPSPYDYNMKQSKMLQYNFTIQRQLPFQMALTVGYVGSTGFNIMQFSEGNPVIPQGVPGVTASGLATCVAPAAGYVPLNIAQQNYTDGTANTCFLGTEGRRNPYWGSFNSLISASGDSMYNGLQVALEKRLSHGLQVQTNFTWSKSMDDTQTQSGSDNSGSGSIWVQDPLHPHLDWAPSLFNLPWTWRLNMLYSFPEIQGNKLVEKSLNGWWMSTVFSFQSGYPFETSFSTSRSRAFNGGNEGGNDRPDVLPGRKNSNITRGATAGCPGVAAGQKLGTHSLYYDPCAFSVQPAGFYGNEGRNSLVGPDFQEVDLSLVKDTKVGFLGEAGMVEFRAEAFNIGNRVNFQMPSLTVFAGTGPANGDVEPVTTGAGAITSALPSREVQLALKVIF